MEIYSVVYGFWKTVVGFCMRVWEFRNVLAKIYLRVMGFRNCHQNIGCELWVYGFS